MRGARVRRVRRVPRFPAIRRRRPGGAGGRGRCRCVPARHCRSASSAATASAAANACRGDVSCGTAAAMSMVMSRDATAGRGTGTALRPPRMFSRPGLPAPRRSRGGGSAERSSSLVGTFFRSNRRSPRGEFTAHPGCRVARSGPGEPDRGEGQPAVTAGPGTGRLPRRPRRRHRATDASAASTTARSSRGGEFATRRRPSVSCGGGHPSRPRAGPTSPMPPGSGPPARSRPTRGYPSTSARPRATTRLTLNVWASSDTEAGDGKPVMVWVHGGAYVLGSAAQSLYRGRALAARRRRRHRHGELPARRVRVPRPVVVQHRRAPGSRATSACVTCCSRCAGCATTSRRSAAIPAGSRCSASRRARAS